MTHPFDTLQLDNGAQIIFTPCPGTKNTSINAALTQLKVAGTSMLVTLLETQEIKRLGVEALEAECDQLNIKWLQLPIEDDAAPEQEFEQRWSLYKTDILNVLANGGTIAVHCKGGTGRTGLVVGLILLALGWDSDKVIPQVQKIRPKAFSKVAQLQYFQAKV